MAEREERKKELCYTSSVWLFAWLENNGLIRWIERDKNKHFSGIFSCTKYVFNEGQNWLYRGIWFSRWLYRLSYLNNRSVMKKKTLDVWIDGYNFAISCHFVLYRNKRKGIFRFCFSLTLPTVLQCLALFRSEKEIVLKISLNHWIELNMRRKIS